MDRRPKQIFLQRGNTDGQKTHEKMISITNYEKTVNQNYNEVSHIPVRMCHAKSVQLCLTLCNPVDYSPLGSSVHGILQARILE